MWKRGIDNGTYGSGIIIFILIFEVSAMSDLCEWGDFAKYFQLNVDLFPLRIFLSTLLADELVLYKLR